MWALIDTGADISLWDQSIADDLGFDLSSAPTVVISGVGGMVREARLAEFRLELLDRHELAVTAEVAFAPDVDATSGNLLGRDIMEYFDFGLSHRNRVGYLRRLNP